MHMSTEVKGNVLVGDSKLTFLDYAKTSIGLKTSMKEMFAMVKYL